MKQTVDKYQFVDSFQGAYKDNFSREGKLTLFDYLEELEESTGTEMELDPIAFCVDYTEFNNLKEIQADYDNIKSMEDLRDHTQVIEIEGTDRIIIQDF